MTIGRIYIGTGLKFLRGHKSSVDRYLARYYHNYEDRDMIDKMFWEHPLQAQTIVEDYLAPEHLKIGKIINNLSYGKSKIIIIVGGRGSGKTCLSMFLVDELHKREEYDTYYFVGADINPEIFPPFIKVVPEIEKVPDFAFAIVDEASLKYSARRSMKDENVLLTGLIATARHHNLTIIFITQHLSLVDISIFKMRDIIFYLKSSDYTIGERGGQNKRDDKRFGLIRNMMQPRMANYPYFESLFEAPMDRRFISFNFAAPDWYTYEISTLFKGYNAKEKLIEERKAKVELKLDFERQKAAIRASAYSKQGIKEIKINQSDVEDIL